MLPSLAMLMTPLPAKTRQPVIRALLLVMALLALGPASLCGQTVRDTQPEMLPVGPHPKGWWPNEGSAPREAYTGPEVCASCHPSESAGWRASEMAHALVPAAESAFLRAHPHMSFQRGPYTYRIDVEGNQAIYSVTGGSRALSIPLLWAYGTGVVGQAFVFQKNGVYAEAEAAFYPVLGKLDVVAGLERAAPRTLEQAFGLPLIPIAAQQCIACHTTAAVVEGKLRVRTMIRGVTCEACHGPGARHAAEMKKLARAGQSGETFIFNPARLDPEDLENFCGVCHRTSERVIREGLHGLDTVHYEPYRLEMSQCWIMTQRITCITCHNPHEPLQRTAAAYDSACLSCHPGQAKQTAAASVGKKCPVATRNCTTCHMPKCRLPLAPFTMSDHFIRIVSPTDACAKSSPSPRG